MFSLKVYRSVKEIPLEQWEAVVCRKVVGLEINHLKAIELSGVNNIVPYYFMGFDNDVPVGIAYCFVMEVDFSRISNKYPTHVLATIKTWNPNFMVMKLIEVGHLASLGATIEIQAGYQANFLEALNSALENIASHHQADLCLIRDIPMEKEWDFQTLSNLGFMPAMGYPLARIPCEWNNFEGYLLALKSKKRNSFLQKRKKILAPEITVEIIENYAPYAERLAELWKNVALRNNGYDHEKLTPEYFVALSETLGKRSHVVAIKRNGNMVAFGLNFIGDEEYFGVAEGMDYSFRDDYELYANTFFECIKVAGELGKKLVNIGITAYDYKASIGAEFYPTLYFVKAFKKHDFTAAYADFIRESIEQPDNYHRCFRETEVKNRIQLKEHWEKSVFKVQTSDLFEKHLNYTRVDFARMVDLYTYCPEFESAQEPLVKHSGGDVIMLGTNSYLGLATNTEIKKAAIAAIEKYGTGCSGSPLLNGTLDIHKQLAGELADFFGKEEALVFSTGYQTNLGAVSALVNRCDCIVMDERNHASLVDGALLSRAKILRYKHNDLHSLACVLEKCAQQPKLIITDSVFSMEGTMVDLPGIVALAKQYNARLMLDESHAIGVIGPDGRGVAAHYNLLDEVDVIMGTFSKSFASVGGFVAGKSKIMDMLRHKSRAHIFSASLPPASVAAVLEAMQQVRKHPQLRSTLTNNAAFLARELKKLGYRINYYGGAIISLHCGHELIALAAFKELFRLGVFVNPVTSPAVPTGEEMLRISLMATHSCEMLVEALEVFKTIKTPYWPL